MGFVGLFAGALLGTALMTLLTEVGQGLHLSRMSLPFVLGTMFTERRKAVWTLGWLSHFAIGLGFALPYGLLFLLLGHATWWIGALAGTVHGFVVLTVVFPLLQEVHPRMATYDQGPDPTPLLQPPGFLGLNYGVQTPVLTVAAHVLYGAILAVFYQSFVSFP
jgi:hypothetical protein